MSQYVTHAELHDLLTVLAERFAPLPEPEPAPAVDEAVEELPKLKNHIVASATGKRVLAVTKLPKVNVESIAALAGESHPNTDESERFLYACRDELEMAASLGKARLSSPIKAHSCGWRDTDVAFLYAILLPGGDVEYDLVRQVTKPPRPGQKWATQEMPEQFALALEAFGVSNDYLREVQAHYREMFEAA